MSMEHIVFPSRNALRNKKSSYLYHRSVRHETKGITSEAREKAHCPSPSPAFTSFAPPSFTNHGESPSPGNLYSAGDADDSAGLGPGKKGGPRLNVNAYGEKLGRSVGVLVVLVL